MAPVAAFAGQSSRPPMIRARFYAKRHLPLLYNAVRIARRHRPAAARHAALAPPAASAAPRRRPPAAMRLPSPQSTQPFSDFFARHFAEHYPHIAPLLRPRQADLAAAVYLFRFAPGLSADFVSTTLHAVARAIAEVSGKGLPESRRLFEAAAKAASHVYFADGWENVPDFVTANTPVLLDLQKRNRKLVALTQSLHSAPTAPEVDPAQLHALLDSPLPLLVMVFADYCSVCKAVRPLFEDAARKLEGTALCVTVNGPRSPQFKLFYNVSSYPTVLRFRGHSDVVSFPEERPVTADSIISFAKGNDVLQYPSTDVPAAALVDLVPVLGNTAAVMPAGEFADLTESAHPLTVAAGEWASVLKRQGIDELDALVTERSEVLQPRIEMVLPCSPSSCNTSQLRTHDTSNGDSPPLCVLLGGGMGAGKTTAVNLIAATPFWKAHGTGVVIVEADAFKLNDPLFHVLPNRIVHHDSIIAAEELFLQAVNSRRDVVFDGTLSWSEYARQTIDMLRDTEYLYERGPGYSKSPSGELVEVYWVRAEKRPKPVAPYCVELVGVTADAEISVMRGIVRKITTGRGVPIPDQLHSHALFSGNFEDYVDLVDAAYLFDTTLNSSMMQEKRGYAEQLVAIKQGILFEVPIPSEVPENVLEGFVVRNPAAYERFLRKRMLNTMASRTAELYAEQLAER